MSLCVRDIHHINFFVRDLDIAEARFASERPCRGLHNSRVVDLDPANTFGAMLQRTEEVPQTEGDGCGS